MKVSHLSARFGVGLMVAATVIAGLLSYCGRADAQEAIQVDLQASVSRPISPATVTLRWDAPGAVSCTASGAWSGTKPPSGVEAILDVRAPGATFRLDCVGEEQGPGSALVRWTPPTTNTDGSPYTNPRGFTIHFGTTPDGLAQTVGYFEPTGTSYNVPDLTPGTWFFCVRALNTSDVSSDCSSTVSHTIAASPAPTGSATAEVTLETQPNPPTAVTVSAGSSG